MCSLKPFLTVLYIVNSIISKLTTVDRLNRIADFFRQREQAQKLLYYDIIYILYAQSYDDVLAGLHCYRPLTPAFINACTLWQANDACAVQPKGMRSKN